MGLELEQMLFRLHASLSRTLTRLLWPSARAWLDRALTLVAVSALLLFLALHAAHVRGAALPALQDGCLPASLAAALRGGGEMHATLLEVEVVILLLLTDPPRHLGVYLAITKVKIN